MSSAPVRHRDHLRFRCPVESCSHSLPEAQGWKHVGNLHRHMKTVHALQSEVPASYLVQYSREFCPQCKTITTTGAVCFCASSSLAQVRVDTAPAVSAPLDGAGPSEAPPPPSTLQYISQADFLASISWEEILQSPKHVLSHVPKAARTNWAVVLRTVITSFVTAPSHDTLKALFLCARCCLHAPARGGRSRSHSLAREVQRRCSRWMEGDIAALWEDFQQISSRSAPRGSQSSSSAAQRACKLVQEGQMSRAVTQLTSHGIWPMSEEILHDLRSLHPPAEPQAVDFSDIPGGDVFSSEEVLLQVNSFPNQSAPGPSAIRPEFLKEALSMDDPRNVLGAITSLVNFFSVRAVSYPDLAPILFGGSLIPFRKKKDGSGIRPIVVSEVFRRLTSKCFTCKYRAQMVDFLGQHQVGVGTPNGSERVVHALRKFIEVNGQEEGWGLLQVDITNAFNTINRSSFLSAVSANFPSISSYVHAAYGRESLLYTSSGHVVCAQGVQQGDPLGPFLFSAGLASILATAHSQVPIPDFCSFFLDDGILAGPLPALAAWFSAFQAVASAHGLTCNRHKSKIFWPTAPSSSQALAAVQDMAQIPTTWDPCSGTQVLGAAIGHTDFLIAHEARLLENLKSLLNLLPSLQHAQIEFRLLRACLGPAKLVHYFRCHPSPTYESPLFQFSSLLLEQVQRIAGVHLSPAASKQALLSVKKGGFGLGLSWPSCYISSFTHCKAFVGNFATMAFDHTYEPWIRSIRHFNSTVKPIDRLSEAGAFELTAMTQKDLMERVSKAVFEDIMSTSDIRTRVRLQSLTLPQSGSFLHATPSRNLGLELKPLEWMCIMNWRLGLPIFHTTDTCPGCGHSLDVFGDHVVSCQCLLSRTSRHHSLRDQIALVARSAGLSPQKEVALSAASNSRPADIFLPQGSLGRSTVVDVTVSHPFRRNLSIRDAGSPGRGLTIGATRKEASKQMCEQLGHDYLVFGIETFGGVSDSCLQLVSYLADSLGRRDGISKSLAVERIWHLLSVTYQRSLARGFIDCLSSNRRFAVQLTEG